MLKETGRRDEAFIRILGVDAPLNCVRSTCCFALVIEIIVGRLLHLKRIGYQTASCITLNDGLVDHQLYEVQATMNLLCNGMFDLVTLLLRSRWHAN